MHRSVRALATASCFAALAIPMAACETSSFSAKCDTGNKCTVDISGTSAQEFPRPFESSDGMTPSRANAHIQIVKATKGGEATIEVLDEEFTCSAGDTYTIIDTTITCEEVGDTSVKLTSTRA